MIATVNKFYLLLIIIASTVSACRNEKNSQEVNYPVEEETVLDTQFRLAMCYAKGDGVAANYHYAAEMLKQAAEQGHIKAQLELGVCYQKGIGVKQNHREAVKWYRKAFMSQFAPSS